MNVQGAQPPEAGSIRLHVPAPDFQTSLSFFVDELDFYIAMISPAEDPDFAVLVRDNFTICLDRLSNSQPGTLEVPINDEELVGTIKQGPNGTQVRYVRARRKHSEKVPLEPTLEVSQPTLGDSVAGRAGMNYRSLLNRSDSGFVASLIRIEGSGSVPDWVHFHDVQFQIIYCLKGSAKLVYEDQGPPFIFSEGDCVLQPPFIRHRVLESYDDLEVIEFSAPSDHSTYADRNMDLPNGVQRLDRDFSGQRFTLSLNSESIWGSYRETDSLEIRETSVSAASGEIGWVNIVRSANGKRSDEDFSAINPIREGQNPDFLLWYITQGSGVIEHCGERRSLQAGDAISCPYGYNEQTEFCLSSFDNNLEILEVGLNSSQG